VGLGEMLLRLFGKLFLCLLYGASRFIGLLGAYAWFVDGTPSIISVALFPLSVMFLVVGRALVFRCLLFVSEVPVCC
jgi:hypothetical protein